MGYSITYKLLYGIGITPDKVKTKCELACNWLEAESEKLVIERPVKRHKYPIIWDDSNDEKQEIKDPNYFITNDECDPSTLDILRNLAFHIGLKHNIKVQVVTGNTWYDVGEEYDSYFLVLNKKHDNKFHFSMISDLNCNISENEKELFKELCKILDLDNFGWISTGWMG